MFCENCGGELCRENKKLKCTKCGAEYGLDYQDVVLAYRNGDTAAAPRGFSSKKPIVFVIMGAVLAVIILVVGVNVGVSHSRAKSVIRGFEIAERYLSELNYEKAVIEFLNILEIEPMNVEAYIGLAKAYIGMGDYEKAISTLQDGYVKTGDERLKTMLDEVMAEASKPKLVFTDMEASVTYLSFGHYARRDGELWRFCDKTGKFIAENKYKYIDGFEGTEEKNYALVTTSDGRVLSIDKNYNELCEFDNPVRYTISEQSEPMVLLWDTTYQNESMRIFTPEGKQLYSWNESDGDSILGNGQKASVNDWVYPDEVKSYVCDCDDTYHEYHKDFFVTSTSVAMDFYEPVVALDDNVYIRFWSFIYYDYNHTAEEAEKERRKQAALANGEVWFEASGSAGFSWSCQTSINVKIIDGELSIGLDKDFTDCIKGPWLSTSIAFPVYEDDNYTIGLSRSLMALDYLTLKSNSGVSKTIGIGTNRKTWSFDGEHVNFDYTSYFINNKIAVCGKYTDDTLSASQYALFEINWDSDAKLNSYKSNIEIMNGDHKRISAFYDAISINDCDKELGYALVGRDGRWGYISLETGEELAMFDDASNFANGYAVVTIDGKGHLIDKDFNAVSDEFPCTSSSTNGYDNAFTVRNGDSLQRLEIN